ncbi:hypothetical protein ACNY68_04885 [Pantoea sp. KXB25]|uniref:hypothetical protein n=1 Tax=unclassified Pantoea TaxID=2630326 RepID=UPI003AB2EF71
MRDLPIIFNADMVRAVLDGRKTQTRRIIQSPAKNMQARGHECISYRAPGDQWYQDYVFSMRDRSGVWQDYKHEQFLAKCPFGAAGDRLWVREAFRVMGRATDVARLMYKARERNSFTESTRTVPINKCNKQSSYNWTPSIHMPRWASRITLEITGVRVERLQDISDSDAKSEGCWYGRGGGEPDFAVNPSDHFPTLWASIYGEESWQANPWVWVIEFKRVEVK